MIVHKMTVNDSLQIFYFNLSLVYCYLRKKIMRYSLLILLLSLTACASASKTYAPDGREAYNLNCSGTARNWGMCNQKAGELCGSKGYDVVTRNGEQGAMVNGSSDSSIGGGGNQNSWGVGGSSSSSIFATTTHSRSMTIACR